MSRETSSNSPASATGIVGPSPAMREVLQLAQRAAKSKASILLLGERGTGKDRLAQAIHQWSDRHAGPFVRVRGSSSCEDLIRGELFGAKTAPAPDSGGGGKLHQANGGTLFFNEIHELPAALQLELLDALQQRRI